MNPEKKIKILRTEIDLHNYKYYVLNEPAISDFEFDQLYNELLSLEREFPQYYDVNSPSKRIGSDIVSDFKTYSHVEPMLSLSNTYSEKELFDFDKRLKKLTHNLIEYVCELKYDGVSISIEYKNGELFRALTRGDGARGDDVTNNVKTIKSIPLKLNGDFPSHFFIRGEIFMTLKNFEDLNKKRINNNLEPFSNPRNTASGTLKMQKSIEVGKRKLDCFLYYIIGEDLPFSNHYENLQKAKEWGFKIPSEISLKNNIEGVVSFTKEWDLKRKELPFEIDGIVIKVNSLSEQKKMGFTSKFPRWAIAYKFKTKQVETVLKSVSYQVGRTGAITPVANLEPVSISGTIVKRASLHNEDQISKLDIRIGDYVFLEKGGEIIPKIVGVNMSKRNLFNAQKLYFIKKCPECLTVLERLEGEVQHYCKNHNFCPPQIKNKIEHFISRKAMNIDSIGKGVIDLLYKQNLINNISDLYELKKDDLVHLNRLGETSVDKLLFAIEESKQVKFERVLFGLGIRFVGETVAKILTKNFRNIEDLSKANFDQLNMINEIGDKIAYSIIEYFKNVQNILLIKKLKEYGLNFESENSVNLSNVLLGKIIVVSGVFLKKSRNDIKKIIEENGGRNTSSISSKTSFIVAGENMGPNKKNMAKKLGIKLISEDNFLDMIP